jgi:histidine phosphotransfer protein HptB
MEMINWDKFKINISDDKEVISEILNVYLDSLPEGLQSISDSIDSKNLEDLKRSAHKLKGSSVSIYAESIGQQCSELEMTTDINEQTLQKFQELSTEIDKLKIELIKFCK